MHLHADYDNSGDGTFTVVAGKTVITNNGTLAITAWDISLQGELDAAEVEISIHSSQPGQSIGLGLTAQDMHISNAELSAISTTKAMSMSLTLAWSP